MENVRLSKLHKSAVLRDKRTSSICVRVCARILMPFAQNVNVNPEMAALYDEKCKQLKGIIDDKLRGSCIRPRLLYVNEIDTSSLYSSNIEKQITHSKVADNSVIEDEQVIIGHDLHDVFLYSIKTGKLPTSCRQGVITLLLKNGDDGLLTK